MVRQGPHQSAQKSTSTGFLEFRIRKSKLLSSRCIACPRPGSGSSFLHFPQTAFPVSSVFIRFFAPHAGQDRIALIDFSPFNKKDNHERVKINDVNCEPLWWDYIKVRDRCHYRDPVRNRWSR